MNVLAKKFNIDQSHETWTVNIFNKLCLMMETNAGLVADLEKTRNELTETKKKLAQKVELEVFLINTAKDKKIPAMFRTRLRKLMKKANLRVNLDEKGEPLLTKKRFTVH